MSLVIEQDAEDDINRAVAWHEARRAGRGQDCRDAFAAALHLIETFPRIGAMVTPAIPGREVRRTFVPVFSYLIFYEVDGNDVTVFHVQHSSQRPGGWVTRLP